MKNSKEQLTALRAKVDSSLNKKAQLQQALAQIEATLLREENQKVSEKSRKI